MDGSSGFTCVTCGVVFESVELQRDHYKTEWHRYNLKRQAAELAPISFDLFNEKAASFTASKTVTVVDTQPLYCNACKKQIKSENAMNDHLNSKKHKEQEKLAASEKKKGPKQPRKKPENVPKRPEPMDEEDDDEDDDSSSGWVTDDGEEMEELNEEDALPVTSCLFCPQTKPKMEDMKQHMRLHHDFTLPDQKYLVDEEGCMNYLGLKVGAGKYCIYCPDRKARFASLDACQKHMIDKQHCKLRRDPESMLELADFYDYSPMYENEDEQNDVLFDDGWSLTLPSGATLGHRSLFRYYKQYLRPVDGTQRIISKSAIEKAKGIYPALAWTGTTNVIEGKKVARDMKFVERFKRRFDLRVAVKSNKLFKSRGFVGDNH